MDYAFSVVFVMPVFVMPVIVGRPSFLRSAITLHVKSPNILCGLGSDFAETVTKGSIAVLTDRSKV